MSNQEEDEKEFLELWESPKWNLLDEEGWIKLPIEIGRFFFHEGRRTLREKDGK